MSQAMKGALLVLLSSLFFSISGTLQALAPEGATPLVIAEVRMICGSVFLFIWCALTGELPKSLKGLPWGTLLSCAGFLLVGQVCFFTGMYHIGVSSGALIAIGSTPLFAAVVTKFTGGNSPRIEWYVATVLAVAGIVLINGFEFQADKFMYIILLLVDGLMYAAYIAVSPRLLDRYGANTSVMMVLMVIALGLSPALFFFPTDWILTARGLAVSAGLGIFTAGLAFTLLTMGSRLVSPLVASTLCLSEPMAAACLGIFLLHEDSSPRTLTGIALIFASIVVLLAVEAWRDRSGKSA